MRGGPTPRSLDIFSEHGRYRAFLGAVNHYLDWAGRDFLARVRLPKLQRFIVGSMGVSMSALLLERYPSARVTYGCLEHLVREIPRLRERYRVPADRVAGMHAHGGAPEADRWGGEAFDLVFLTKKMILGPEERVGERFATKAFEVLRPGGVAVLWESIYADRGPTPLGRAMEAFLDLGASPRAALHTEGSMRALLTGIGYREIEIVHCLDQQTSFVVATK